MLKHLVRLFLLVSLGTLRVGGAEKPNVLFLAVDDMNDWIGCLHQLCRCNAGLGDPSSAEDRNVFLPYMTPGEYAIIN